MATATVCRLSGKPLIEVIDLGELYVSNFYASVELDAPRAPLRIGIGEESGLLQLMDPFDRPPLYEQYWYRSGTNETMSRQLHDVVNAFRDWVYLKPGDVVLDIGCNDGTLLSHLPRSLEIVRVGIDPAENLAAEARAVCDAHSVGFFGKDRYLDLTGGRKARVITSIAMFYGVEDPMPFVKDVADCLTDDGVWVLQLSYTPLMIKQNAFDNICHEHIYYYTLLSLKYLLDQADLEILDVELNDANAGSFRITSCKKGQRERFGTAFLRDIGRPVDPGIRATAAVRRARRLSRLHEDDQRPEGGDAGLARGHRARRRACDRLRREHKGEHVAAVLRPRPRHDPVDRRPATAEVRSVHGGFMDPDHQRGRDAGTRARLPLRASVAFHDRIPRTRGGIPAARGPVHRPPAGGSDPRAVTRFDGSADRAR